MLNVKDIEEATFRKAHKGYKTEDVDDFLDEVKESYEKLMEENAILKSKLSEALEKNRVMASDITAMRTRMDDYKTDGDEIKNALISAHKAADATIRDAKAKANEIVAAAQKTADEELGGLGAKVEAKERELETMKQMVSDFRAKIFDMYKDHLAMIDNIPVYTAKQPEPVQVVEEPVIEEVVEEVVVAAEPVIEVPAEEDVAPVSAPEVEPTYNFSNFMSDTIEFRPRKRADLKFGDTYDISKDK
ncbi:MAG: DivIVA domain-containing protein [Clostridia bacterium]|nr:DivIVA domain-containing protein [Clostridia bacterium]